ncbi:50S ribosomal protein L24e [Candidatus Woesearchaeota archaeon]|nr:50S ribosomal protein L24e [Candidatus Woesearchaeota archaeon]
MAKCSFCGTLVEPGTGIMYVKKDGKILYFCKRKCEKNMLILGRKERLTQWTAAFRKEKEVKKEGKQ